MEKLYCVPIIKNGGEATKYLFFDDGYTYLGGKHQFHEAQSKFTKEEIEAINPKFMILAEEVEIPTDLFHVCFEGLFGSCKYLQAFKLSEKINYVIGEKYQTKKYKTMFTINEIVEINPNYANLTVPIELETFKYSYLGVEK